MNSRCRCKVSQSKARKRDSNDERPGLPQYCPRIVPIRPNMFRYRSLFRTKVRQTAGKRQSGHQTGEISCGTCNLSQNGSGDAWMRDPGCWTESTAWRRDRASELSDRFGGQRPDNSENSRCPCRKMRPFRVFGPRPPPPEIRNRSGKSPRRHDPVRFCRLWTLGIRLSTVSACYDSPSVDLRRRMWW